MIKFKCNFRKKILWEDIQNLVSNVNSYYKTYFLPDKSPLILLMAVYTIYKKHMDKQPDKNINLNVEANRPKVLRSEIIKKCSKTEHGEKIANKYNNVKGQINDHLKELIYKKDKKTRRILNPKGLVIRPSERKGEAEEFNYFVIPDPLPKPPQKPQIQTGDHLPMASFKPMQVLRNNLNRWKLNNFLGEKALKPNDLIKIETEISPADLNDEHLAYFYISCVYRRHNYHTWWKEVKGNKKIIWHLCNLLFQSYHRPFWRAAFILQYVESSAFSKIISEFPNHILENERIKTAIATVINKNVEIYLSENRDQEMYAEELLKEFRVYKYNFEDIDG